MGDRQGRELAGHDRGDQGASRKGDEERFSTPGMWPALTTLVQVLPDRDIFPVRSQYGATYYLLHRESFGMTDAPVGAAILYALSCGLSDSNLTDRWEILARGKSGAAAEAEAEPNNEGEEPDGEDDDEAIDEGGAGGSSTVRLRPWNARKRKALGLEGIGGKSVPMIDRLHRLMALWREGEIGKVDAFLSEASLTRDPLFPQIVQAVIELARRDGKPDEAVIIESISRHMQSRSGLAGARQAVLI
jgi:putative DNA methylase